jgi:hypothetical protein
MYMPLLAVSRSTPEPIYQPLVVSANTAVYPDDQAERQQLCGSRVVRGDNANFFVLTLSAMSRQLTHRLART